MLWDRITAAECIFIQNNIIMAPRPSPMGMMRSNECDGYYYFLFRLLYNDRREQHFSRNNKTVKTGIFDIPQWLIPPTRGGCIQYYIFLYNSSIKIKTSLYIRIRIRSLYLILSMWEDNMSTTAVIIDTSCACIFHNNIIYDTSRYNR